MVNSSEFLKTAKFGDLNFGLGIDGNVMPEFYRPATIPRTMDLLNPQSDFGAPIANKDLPTNYCVNKAAKIEPEKAQMTIFYGGQVLVFNDVPANKAKEVMLFASMSSSMPVRKPNDSVSTTNIFPTMDINLRQRLHRCIDLPIQRKASLTRFFEKRKDRINARAPYNASEGSATPSKPIEDRSWLCLAPQ